MESKGCFEIIFKCLNDILKVQINVNNNISIPIEPPDDHNINCGWFILYILLYITTIFIGGTFAWENIIFFPLIFCPGMLVYKIYKYYVYKGYINPDKTRISDIFRSFCHSFFGAGIVALIYGGIFGLLLQLILFYSKIVDINFEDISKGNLSKYKNYKIIHLYVFINGFFIAGLIEELIKGFLVQYCVKLYLPHKNYLNRNNIKSFTWIGLSIGLGFGTIEGIIYTCIYTYDLKFIEQFQVFLIRIFIAIPFHSILGIIWGIMYAKKQCCNYNITWLKMGYIQIILHGIYDVAEMELGILINNETKSVLIGLILALLYVLLCGIYAYKYEYQKITSNIDGNRQFIPEIDEYDDPESMVEIEQNL